MRSGPTFRDPSAGRGAAPGTLVPRGTVERALPGRPPAQWALAGLGLSLLGLLIYQAGPRQLATHLSVLGWSAPLVFLPYALASAFDAAGWGVTFARVRPSLWLLYIVRLIGESLNNVTPTAYLGGEPVKAYLLHRFGVPLAEGASSVILAKTALTVGQMAFVIIGVALLLLHQGAGWSSLPTLLALVAAGMGVTALLVRWQQRGLVASLARGLRRLLPRTRLAARLEGRAADIDERVRAFYGDRPRAAIASVVLHLIGWIAGALEVYAIMALIGQPVGWGAAVIIEALAQPLRLLGVVVPGTLGVQEAGGMLIFGLLGLAPELGLAMMLVKRLREIVFSIIGLALLAHLRPRTAG